MADSSERSIRDEDKLSPHASSTKRGSKSRSSRSSHRHSPPGSSSSGHRRKSSTSHSSPHSQSPKTPGSGRSSKDKLRISKSDGSKIGSAPVSSSPGAHNVSSSARNASRKSSKFSRRSSRQSEPGATRASDSDRRAERKASRNESRQQGSPSLTSPGARSVSSSSDRDRRRKSSKFSRERRTGDSIQSRKNQRQLAKLDATGEVQPPPLLDQEPSPTNRPLTLEATAAPQDFEDQLEDARQQAREQGRLEERNERRAKKPLVAASTSDDETNNKGSRKYKYLLIALVILLAIGGGVAAWQLLPRENLAPTSVNLGPSAEDCLAVSEGSELDGQGQMTSKTVAVELNLTMASDVDLEQLKAELESKLQRDVLPVLVWCGNEGPVSAENNILLIENAMLMLVSISNSTSCSSNAEETCSSVNLELLLYLSDDGNEVDQSVLNLVTDLFQDERLLELLQLDSPVTEVNLNQVIEILPSLPPSSSPSTQELPVLGDRCQAIANGTPIAGQETLSVLPYEVLLDVVLNAQADLSLLSVDLQRQLQAVIVPALADCNVVRRRQALSSIETVMVVKAEHVIDGSCLPGSETLCYRFIVYLDIFVESALSSGDFAAVIRGEFQKPSSSTLVSRLGLASPFERIAFVGVLARTISKSPSANPTAAAAASLGPTTMVNTQSPTSGPSLMPSVGPTIAMLDEPGPTTMPVPATMPVPDSTVMPAVGPTLEPISSPLSQPTLLPTAPPTPLPTLPPTTLSPTPRPTTPQPTLPPTISPTPRPTTPQPTRIPSTSPSPQPSTSPSFKPTTRPSIQPSRLPSRQPSIPPSRLPSRQPSASPSRFPFTAPSRLPSTVPSRLPSRFPSTVPSRLPSQRPSVSPSVWPSPTP